jgi:hypothetical protein
VWEIACALLSMLLVAGDDSPVKPASGLAALAGLSDWKFVPLARNGLMFQPHPKDFQDTRFQYRWKSEWVVNRYVCTVEIRPTDDIDGNFTVPQIDIGYSGPNRVGLHFQFYTAHDVPIGSKLAHAVVRRPDCQSVELVSWSK